MVRNLLRRTDPASCQILTGALPIIGFLLFRAAIFIVDRLLLGHYSVDALASLQISASFLFVILGLLGTCIVVGTREIDRRTFFACANVRALLLISLVLGAVGVLGSFLVKDSVIALFSANSFGTLVSADEYLIWTLPFLPLYLVVMTMQLTLQAANYRKSSFRILCLGVLLHSLFGVAFVFGHVAYVPRGAAGAAIASVSATAIQGILLFWLLGRTPRFRLNLWQFGHEWEAAKEILKGALPQLADRLVQYATFFAMVWLVGMLGTEAMAAQSALLAIGVFCFVLIDGFARSASILEAVTFADIRRLTLSAFTFLSLVGAALVCFPRELMGLFSPNQLVILLGASCMPALALSQPLASFAVLFGDLLKGEVSLFRFVPVAGGVVRVLAAYYFAFELHLGLVGIWWGVCADWLFRSLATLAILVHERKVTLSDKLSRPL